MISRLNPTRFSQAVASSTTMSDFIMTLSSDDEGPALPSASKAKAGSSKKTAAAAVKGGKLTRKEQLAQKKGAKAQKNQKRKRFDQVSDEEDDEGDAGMAATGEDETEKMAADFVFDGLGGGFVGDRRNNVWVSFDSLQRITALD